MFKNGTIMFNGTLRNFYGHRQQYDYEIRCVWLNACIQNVTTKEKLIIATLYVDEA